MPSRLVPITDTDSWNGIVRSCDAYDVYHLAGYQRAPTPMDCGDAVLAVVEDDASGYLAALPLRLRRVNDIEVIAATGKFSDGICDATSPYGYPGLIVRSPIPDSRFPIHASRFPLAKSLAALFAQHDIIAAFIRQHPLIDTTSWFAEPFTADAIGLTVAVDLTLPEAEYEKQTRKSHRTEIQSWSTRGAVFERLDRPDFPKFGRAYRETMARKGARARYLFDDSYFAALARQLGDACRIYSARTSTTPPGVSDAMALVLTCGEAANYHLAATSDEPAHSGLSRWLLEQIRLALKGEGYATLHLGGGVGASGDTLFQFKSGFSKWRPDFEVVKWIGDSAMYRQLCDVTAAPPDSDFFPAYR